MSKHYTIYTLADPGPALVALTAELIEPLEYVDSVKYVAWQLDMGKPGAYDPIKKEIIIDLGNIINNCDLHKMGMLYLSGIWYTALWTLFHETVHAQQVEADPDIIELIKATEEEQDMLKLASDYENAAQIATKTKIIEWTETNNIPPINEWAWMGEQVTELINALYAKGDAKLLDELDLLNMGAAAEVDAILATYEHDDSDKMYKCIDEGQFGIKDGDNYYLTANDFFGLDRPVEAIARSAQTIFMVEIPVRIGKEAQHATND